MRTKKKPVANTIDASTLTADEHLMLSAEMHDWAEMLRRQAAKFDAAAQAWLKIAQARLEVVVPRQ